MIQAGDSVCGLPYFRHSTIEHKVDFLFKLNDTNLQYITGKNIEFCEIDKLAYPLPSQQFMISENKKAITVFSVSPAALGAGLSLALALTDNVDSTLFLFELETDSPFKLQPSHIYIPYLPPNMTATLGMLEDKNIMARFVSWKGLPGCFEGGVGEVPLP